MQSKLVRLFFEKITRSQLHPKRFRSVRRSKSHDGFRAFLISFFVFCVIFFSLEYGFAEIRLQPANGGSRAIQTTNLTSHKFFYFVNNTPTTGFADFTILNLNPTTIDETNTTDMFEINVTATDTFTVTGNERAVITFFALPEGGNPHPAPIAAVDGRVCAGGANTKCMWKNAVSLNIDRYYAALYPSPQATVKVGFYPKLICNDANEAGVIVTGCNTSNPSAMSTPTAAQPVTLQLKYKISKIPNPDPSASPTSDVVTQQNPVTLSFSIDEPSFSCPAATDLNEAYFPGDGEILFNPMAPGGIQMFSLTNASTSDAPADKLIVVGNEGTTSQVTTDVSSSYTSNELVNEVSLTDLSVIGGLTNSTDSTLISYTFSFLMRDQAGIIVPSNSGSACTLSPVFSSKIDGFLNSSDCFIATATFGSSEALPVLLFREFRDEFLMRYDLGVQFVDWYYDWSPESSQWLKNHPYFRFFSLVGLFYLQVLSFLVLYPLEALGVCLLIVLSVGALRLAWRSRFRPSLRSSNGQVL